MTSLAPTLEYGKYIKQLNLNLAIFWTAFFLFVFSNAVLGTHVRAYFVPLQVVQSSSILAMVYSCAQLVQFKVRNEFLGILLVSHFIWCFYIIFNGFVYEYDFLKFQIFSGFLKYFFPLVIFFPKTLRYYKFQFDFIFYGAVAFLFLNLIFFEEVTTHYETNVNQKFTFEAFVRNLGVPIGFLLLTFIYHSKTRIAVSLVSLILMVGVATFRARRAIMVIALAHIFIFLVIYFLYTNRKLVVTILFVIIGLIVGSYANSFYNEKRDFFATLEERGTEDTRTNVENMFRRDFETVDWVFGRGINGEYWCPSIDVNNTSGFRSMIETDYLNIILKGGILHLAMLLLFLIPAMFYNLFRSNNLLSKAAGIWIILWILSLYPMNVFNFDINYLLIWTCVCIGFSPSIRKMSDEVLKKAFS